MQDTLFEGPRKGLCVHALNRQVIRSRRALQFSLLELAEEKPFSKITISEIAERADLARSTFYSHFEDKRSVLASFVDDIFDPFVELIVERGTVPEPSDSEIALQTSVCQLWKEQASALRLIRSCGHEMLILDKLRKVHATIYGRVIQKRYPHLGQAIGSFAIEYVAVTYFGVLMWWLENGLLPSAEIMGRMLYQLTGPPILIEILNEYSMLFASPEPAAID